MSAAPQRQPPGMSIRQAKTARLFHQKEVAGMIDECSKPSSSF
jgi:hypothetical protein